MIPINFPNLPTELRLQIWALVAESPRMLHIRVEDRPLWTSAEEPDGLKELEYDTVYSSPTPPPAMLHVCLESRQVAPYERSFLTSPSTSEERYIWVNFQQDMICLPDTQIHWLEPYGGVIQRLRFTMPLREPGLPRITHDYRFLYSEETLEPFTALRELHISIPEKFRRWGSRAEDLPFQRLGRENVRFIDLHTGLSLKPDQYAMLYCWFSADGGKVYNMDNIDGELHSQAYSPYKLFNLSEMAKID